MGVMICLSQGGLRSPNASSFLSFAQHLSSNIISSRLKFGEQLVYLTEDTSGMCGGIRILGHILRQMITGSGKYILTALQNAYNSIGHKQSKQEMVRSPVLCLWCLLVSLLLAHTKSHCISLCCFLLWWVFVMVIHRVSCSHRPSWAKRMKPDFCHRQDTMAPLRSKN